MRGGRRPRGRPPARGHALVTLRAQDHSPDPRSLFTVLGMLADPELQWTHVLCASVPCPEGCMLAPPSAQLPASSDAGPLPAHAGLSGIAAGYAKSG